MKETDLLNYSLKVLKKAGAQKAQCRVLNSEKNEICFDSRKISLLRTTRNTELRLAAIIDGRMGTAVVNDLSPASLSSVADSLVRKLARLPRDSAHDIAPAQPAQRLSNGVGGPDLKMMYARLAEFRGKMKRAHGKINIQDAIFDFVREKSFVANSNGVRLASETGRYGIDLAFSAKSYGKTSSVNYAAVCSRSLSAPILSWGGLGQLFKQSAEQLSARPLRGKFEGEILISPDALGEFLRFLHFNALRDNMLLAGTSPYKDKAGQQVASRLLTLQSLPRSKEMAAMDLITPDGYPAEDSTIIRDGVLLRFLLSSYGAKRLAVPYVPNAGGAYSVLAGKQRRSALVKSIKRGLLVTRFAGDYPSKEGDFSGIAKNSYYVENGKIKYPVSETMISGNIPSFLLQIRGVSKERINFGNMAYPWVLSGGVFVSGK